MKKILKTLTIFIMLLVTISLFRVQASSKQYVYLGGDSIGLKMNTGVYVVGKYEVQTKSGKVSPWQNSNINVGDTIEKINGIKVDTNKQLINYLNQSNQDIANLQIKRGNTSFNTNIEIIKNSTNEKSIGLYIRDQILGIGTLTFITENNQFASLGHGVYDNQVLLSVASGDLYRSSVRNIKKSEPGIAGEKRASLERGIIGTIYENDVTGLYGKLENISKNNKLVEVANQKDVKNGPAKIYTVVDGHTINEYNIEIIDIKRQSRKGVKGIKFKVTDSNLVSKTGGIVQGMSGSPIVQDGKIIGAVSHVTVENPIYGYAMHIEWMVDEANRLNRQ